MEYDTKVINAAAAQIAEMLKSAVNKQQQNNEGNPGIATIETDMRGILRQIGVQAMGQLLSSMQTTPVKEIACECGGTLKYQRMREAKVISVFGKVTYERAYYAECECKKGKAPLDERFGLKPGAITAGLANLLALAGIEFSYDESPKWLEEYLLFDVSANTVRCETEKLGEKQKQREEELIRKSQDEGCLQDRQRDLGPIHPQLYGSIDAAKVRTEPRPKKGEEKEEHEDWRDMKVLCWFETETVPPSQRSKRQQEKAAREQTPLRAKNMQYHCDITDADKFGKLLWATGCTLNADLCPDLIFLGDGGVWIWNQVTQYYPNAKQIVDWFHAEEHLETVAAAVFSNVTQRTDWLETVTQYLWDGQVEEVIASCEILAPSCSKAAQDVNYFTTNKERMRYDRFRSAGYMIGSGIIESACKQIVTQRLKLPGAQWEVDGAVHTAKARAAWLSGHWKSLCDQRSTLPIAA